jgi:hypothetical protein
LRSAFGIPFGIVFRINFLRGTKESMGAGEQGSEGARERESWGLVRFSK